MIFYDLIHGYQPFNHPFFVPKWIKRNLREVFLPTSYAMKKGLVRRGVQLQGWTIDAWINASQLIRNLAKKTINNLKTAIKKKNIEIGVSSFSHGLLPLFSNDLIAAQILIDYETVNKYLGKPVWFWPPEGALDQRTLKIIFETLPDLIVLMPDKCIGKYNFSGPIKIKYGKRKYQKVLVFSCLLKDLFMNAEDYRQKPKYIRRPKHLHKGFIWKEIRRIVHSSKIFQKVLKDLGRDNYVLMRDWENAGSRRGLRKKNGSREIRNFLILRDKIKFQLPSQNDWSKVEIVKINEILPASWDMESSPRDPFPWWWPNKNGKIWRHLKPFRKKKILEWQKIIKKFDEIFQKRVKKQGGLEKALKNKKFKEELKKTLPALHSCVAWHYLAKRAWRPDYYYSQEAFKKIVLPALEKIRGE